MFGRSVRRRAWGGPFIVSSNHRYEFRAFTPDGSPARIVRMDHVLRVPTDENIEAEIHERVSRIVDPAERRAERRELRAMPVAEHLPAFAAVRTDRLDHLWVHEYEAPGEETPGTHFTVFDPDGRVLGLFETPEGMGIPEIGEDYILARVRDELGVDYVQVWPLERGGG